MKHRIRRDGVHLTVCPAIGIDVTGECGLLVQDVIPLQHNRQLLTTQETVRQLSIPYQFVGIQRGIAITPATEHVDICRKVSAPRESNLGVPAV